MADIPLSAPSDDARKAFYDDFQLVQSKVENPTPDTYNPFYKSRFTSLAALLETLRPLLNEHNFILTQGFGFAEDTRQVFGTHLIHKDGGVMSTEVFVPLIDDPQKVVIFATYMRRAHLCAMLGIREQDDDGQGVAEHQPQRAASGPPMPVAPPAPVAPAPIPNGAPPAPPAPTQMPAPPAGVVAAPAVIAAAAQVPTPVPQPPAPPAPSAPPAPPAPPAPVAPSPNGTGLNAETLADARGLLGAVEQHFGAETVQGILQRKGLTDISQMQQSMYAAFAGEVFNFVEMQGKKLTNPAVGAWSIE